MDARDVEFDWKRYIGTGRPWEVRQPKSAVLLLSERYNRMDVRVHIDEKINTSTLRKDKIHHIPPNEDSWCLRLLMDGPLATHPDGLRSHKIALYR